MTLLKCIEMTLKGIMETWWNEPKNGMQQICSKETEAIKGGNILYLQMN